MFKQFLNKTIAVLTAVILFSTVGVSAEETNQRRQNILSDLVDMDRVYEYDLKQNVKQETDEVLGEVIVHKNAVWSVQTLKLMDLQTGNLFNEDKTVPFNEFASILIKLSAGGQTGFEESYMNYGDTRPATMGECVSYMFAALGYTEDFFAVQSNKSKVSYASKLGMLYDITYSEAKHITRGELAQLIYNCLEIPMMTQTVYSDTKQEYQADESCTILSERFDLFSVRGICTTQFGQDIYTDVYYDKDLIGIDRGMYDSAHIKVDDVLGYRVLAYAKNGNSKHYELVGVTVDEDDKTVDINTNDLDEVTASRLSYTSGDDTERVNISSVKRVVYNGKIYDREKLDDGFLYSISGRIRICEGSNSGMETVIVNSYKDLVLQNVSSYTQQITFKYGLKYNGNTYVDFSDSDDMEIRIIKNGKNIPYTELLPNDVVSIMETSNPYFVNIIATDERLSGEISSIEDDVITISGKQLTISDSYAEANKISNIFPEISLGLSGDFSISCDDEVVAYNTGSGYSYGYMRMVGKDGASAFDTKYMARIFTIDGDWQSYEFADKLTLDGIKSVTKEDAYDIISKNSSTACYSVIRYEINGSKKITFLDTAIDNDVEQNDRSAIRKEGTWSNKFSWTVSASKIDLLYSKYWLTPETVVFNVPDDKDNEKLYTASIKPQFVAESTGNLVLYSADDFYNIPVVESGGSSGGSSNSFYAMYITNIGLGLNDEGEEVYIIRGANAVSQSKWELNKMTTSPLMRETGLTCKVGDIIQYKSSGSRITDYSVIMTAEDIASGVQKRPASGASPEYIFAEVVDADSARDFVKVSINDNEYVFFAQSAGICDFSTGKVENVSVGDYVQGDKIFMIGATDWMRTLVIR